METVIVEKQWLDNISTKLKTLESVQYQQNIKLDLLNKRCNQREMMLEEGINFNFYPRR